MNQVETSNSLRGPKKTNYSDLQSTLGWILDPLSLLDSYASKYGEIISVDLGKLPPLVYLSHPEAVKQVFSSPPSCFSRVSKNTALRILLGENSLFLLDGESHQQHREILMPLFNADRLKDYGHLMNKVINKNINAWPLNKPVEIRQLLLQNSIEIILKCIFGITQDDRVERLNHSLQSVMNNLNSPLFILSSLFKPLQISLGGWSSWGKFERKMEDIDKHISNLILDRKVTLKVRECNDILGILLGGQNQEKQLLTDKEIRDELLTLFFTGTDTTVSALVWSLYWFSRSPNVQSRLLDELNSLSTLSPNNIVSLPYLTAFCKEVLRIYPPTPIATSRILKNSCEIMGHRFDRGTVLVPVIYLVHRREDLYPQSDQFRPERFLERKFSSAEYLPFGGGSRSCIGMTFALNQMKLVLAQIFRAFDVKLESSTSVRPVRRGITLAPPSKLKLVFRPH